MISGQSRIEAHNERTKEKYASNPDIKTELSKYNFHPFKYQGKYRTVSDRMIREAGCKVRKDSVTMVETLITASPEFFAGKKPREVSSLEQQLAANTKSVLEELQKKQRMLELEEKERLLVTIPPEIVEKYNKKIKEETALEV